jgi:hypothetical protein
MDRGAGPVDVCESSWVATSSRLIAAHFRFSGTCDSQGTHPFPLQAVHLIILISGHGMPRGSVAPTCVWRRRPCALEVCVSRELHVQTAHQQLCPFSSIAPWESHRSIRPHGVLHCEVASAFDGVKSRGLGLRCASFFCPWRSRNFSFPRRDRLETGCRGCRSQLDGDGLARFLRAIWVGVREVRAPRAWPVSAAEI